MQEHFTFDDAGVVAGREGAGCSHACTRPHDCVSVLSVEASVRTFCASPAPSDEAAVGAFSAA